MYELDIPDFTGTQIQMCSTHNLEMQPAVVLINQLGSPDEPPSSTRDRLFPHSGTFVWGDYALALAPACVARIYVCPECQRAEKQWRLAKQQSK